MDFTCFTTRQPNNIARNSASVGCRRVTIFKSAGVVAFKSRSCSRNESAPTLRTSHGRLSDGGFKHLEQAQIFLLLQNRQRLRREIRRDDDFAENLRDGFGARRRRARGSPR